MNERDFCFWLQGLFEVNAKEEPLNVAQVNIIRNHLNLVFHHSIDPQTAEPGSANDHFLNNIHDGTLPQGVRLRC